MADRLTPSELARELGVSRQAIYNLQTRGVLPRDSDGKLDRAQATAAIAAAVSPTGRAGAAAAKTAAPAQPTAPSAQPPIDLIQAKTLREITEAQIAKVKLDEMLGKLVPIVDLENALRATHLAAREWLRAEARPIAEECAGLSADAIERALQRTFDAFLIRLATWQDAAEDDEDENDDDLEDDPE